VQLVHLGTSFSWVRALGAKRGHIRPPAKDVFLALSERDAQDVIRYLEDAQHVQRDLNLWEADV
jgi:hypothetical protein